MKFWSKILLITFVLLHSVVLSPGVLVSTVYAEDAGDTVNYAGGLGTDVNPYRIADWNHLNNVRLNLGDHFLLIDDLDDESAGYITHVHNGTTLVNEGLGWEPIGTTATKFTGSFDGGGKTISDLTINRPLEDNIGLFGVVDSSVIENIGLINVDVTGNIKVGGLIGENRGTVTTSYATGNVNGQSAVGGLVGENYSAVTNSYATVDVTATGDKAGGLIGLNDGVVSSVYSIGEVKGVNDVGGLIGLNVNSVRNTYATGNVIATGIRVGGLVGYNTKFESNAFRGSIGNSYSNGAVSGAGNLGGLVGSNGVWPDSGSVYDSNFWDTETSGLPTSATLSEKGKTTEEMRQRSTYQGSWIGMGGWDKGVWTFHGGGGATVEGYEYGGEILPYLTEVTRVVDRDPGVEAYLLFEGGWGGLTDEQTGADGSAYTITNPTQLQNINVVADYGFDFNLSNAIDLEDVHWTPIGNTTYNPYDAKFNGQNYTISNLTVGGVDQINVGLFGFIHEATLINIHLDGVQASGSGSVGGLVGRTSHSTNTIKNISITSTVRDSRIELSRTGEQGNYFGAVGGYIDSSLENIDSHAIVFLSDAINQSVNSVGGLVGEFFAQSIDAPDAPNNLVNHGDVIVNLTGDSNTQVRRIGGLFGNYSNDTPLSNVEMNGNVIAVTQRNGEAGLGSVGGIFGTGSLNINNAVMRGDVRTHITIGGTQYISGTAGWIGGLFGDAGDGGEIANSAMYGNVEVLLSGPLEEGSWNNYGFGGVLGVSWDDVTFNNVHAYGDVTLEIPGEPVGFDGFSTGGLLGEVWANLNIIDSTMEGNISGLNGVGGLAGIAWYGAEITNSHFLGDTISGHDYVGGLLGQFHENWENNTDSFIVTHSSSKGTISGNDYVGGLVGQLSNENVVTHQISQSYSTATVTSDGDFAGGLVGLMKKAAIDNAYFAGSVSGANTVGGLVGQMTADSNLTNTYSSAVVTGDSLHGGLVGVNGDTEDDNVTNSFWNTTVNDGMTSAGGVGKTTAELQTLSTFQIDDENWSIASTTSTTYAGHPYPGLRMVDDGAVWQLYVYVAPPPPTEPPSGDDGGGGDGGGGGGGTTPPPATTTIAPTTEPTTIIASPVPAEQIAETTETETTIGKETTITTTEGRNITIIQIAKDKITDKIQQLINQRPTPTQPATPGIEETQAGTGEQQTRSEQRSQREQNTVEIATSTPKTDTISAQVTGDIVKAMETGEITVAVKTNNIQYIIPAKEIGIDRVAENLNIAATDLASIAIEIKIETATTAKQEQIEQRASQRNAVIVLAPVSFQVIAHTTSSTGETKSQLISNFNQYVERIIELPEDIDPSKITTGIIYDDNGTFDHVPTEIYEQAGKWFVRLNSLTNSDYTIIYNPITVESVEGHWSEQNVNDMASRIVIAEHQTFKPNEVITRAEFADYIVRAVGLYRVGSYEHGLYSDINRLNIYRDSITLASQYGIIQGYEDQTFRPEATITREEAMTMYARAMDIVELRETEIDLAARYTDETQISDWAYDYVKKTVSGGVFQGRTATTINPLETFTKAEAATAIRNMLIKAELINK